MSSSTSTLSSSTTTGSDFFRKNAEAFFPCLLYVFALLPCLCFRTRHFGNRFRTANAIPRTSNFFNNFLITVTPGVPNRPISGRDDPRSLHFSVKMATFEALRLFVEIIYKDAREDCLSLSLRSVVSLLSFVFSTSGKKP